MTKILAVIDPLEETHSALERMKELPPDSDLDIYAVLFIEAESAETYAHTLQEKQEWLNEQVRPYVADGYKITTKVVNYKHLYEAVVELAQKHQVDFVVKPMRQHTLFQSVIRTSTDWNLIRHCPYPLLLVSDIDTIKGKPVIGAVDVCTGEENHEKLNGVILDQTKAITRVLDSRPVVANAWRATTPMMAVGSVDATPYPTPKDLEKEHVDAARTIAEDFGVPLDDVYVEEGSPSLVVNEVANRLGAGVIVIGTVARKGISGALIGNTAEGVLEATSCDVMVVKLPSV